MARLRVAADARRIALAACLLAAAPALAERARANLDAEFLDAPRGRIDLVVTDHADVANATAAVWPSNRVVAFVRPPADSIDLAYFDDYLELLIVHELAHVHHLDYSDDLGRFFRRLVGRSPTVLSFPGTLAPGWVIEGIGTWYESALTGAVRVHGTYHEMILRTAALEGRFESRGQAEGNSPLWPGGTRRYAYGSLFVDYLLETYGRNRMGAFARDLASLRNMTPNRMANRVFGVSLSEAWETWADGWREAGGGRSRATAAIVGLVDRRPDGGCRPRGPARLERPGTGLYVRRKGRGPVRVRLPRAHLQRPSSTLGEGVVVGAGFPGDRGPGARIGIGRRVLQRRGRVPGRARAIFSAQPGPPVGPVSRARLRHGDARRTARPSCCRPAPR